MVEISNRDLWMWGREHGRHRHGQHPPAGSYTFKMHDDLREALDQWCMDNHVGKSHALNYLVSRLIQCDDSPFA